VTQNLASVACADPDMAQDRLSSGKPSRIDVSEDVSQDAGQNEMRQNSPERLACTRLTLSHYRCYEHLRLQPGTDPVVLTGANGAGKTNVLEALSYLVPGSGLRRAKLSDLGRRTPGGSPDQGPWGSESRGEKPGTSGFDAAVAAWAVAAEIGGGRGSVSLGTGMEPGHGTKRVVHVDGAVQRAVSVLADHFAVHWLTPQMDRLFLDGSQERRRFLDRLVFAFDPAHAGRITAYNHALRERARLLMDARQGQGRLDETWLSALEDTMATRGMAVAAARLAIAERLAGAAQQAVGPFPAGRLAIDGLAEGWLMSLPALEVEDRLRTALKGTRGGDGGALAGGRLPHQSDLVVTHVEKAMPAGQCSTGEQKMLLVGLVLAAARLSATDEDRVPVLLLDEVAAHLDAPHREALFGEVLELGCQAWFTGTDPELFDPLSNQARFYSLADGQIVDEC